MARLFSVELINERIDGTDEISSSQEHADLLGRADQVCLQVRATGVSGTSPVITLKYWGSNDGKAWVTQVTHLNAVALTPGAPYESMVDTGSVVLGANGKVTVKLGGTTPSATVKVMAVGRTS